MAPRVVLDTNIFVAAGFRPASASGCLLEQVRSGSLRLVWNEATRRETLAVLARIPPLSRQPFDELFRDEERCDAESRPDRFDFVPDPEDRKFLALAETCGVPLVTLDQHLLGARDRASIPILRPTERIGVVGAGDGPLPSQTKEQR
jgi:predicted nucleic acid-binding protein